MSISLDFYFQLHFFVALVTCYRWLFFLSISPTSVSNAIHVHFFYHSLLEFSPIFLMMVLRNQMEIESKVDLDFFHFCFVLQRFASCCCSHELPNGRVENKHFSVDSSFVHISFFVSTVRSDRTLLSTSPHWQISQKNHPINNINSRIIFPPFHSVIMWLSFSYRCCIIVVI